MNKTFLIVYTIYDKNNAIVKTGETRAKNKINELDAKCSFEEFLKKKYENFHRLVIHKCTDESNEKLFNNLFGDTFKDNNIFDSFGDIFGGKNGNR